VPGGQDYPYIQCEGTKINARAYKDPVLRREAADEVYGVIYAEDGLAWLLKFCRRHHLRFVDLGSGVGNLLATASLCGEAVAGVELNKDYHAIALEVFDKLDVDAEFIANGDMFEWRPPPGLNLYFCNNEKLQGHSTRLLSYLLTMEPGSFIVTLLPLPISRLKRLCKGRATALGSSVTKGTTTVTYVEHVVNATKCSWAVNSNGGCIDWHVYAVTSPGQEPTVKGQTQGTAEPDLASQKKVGRVRRLRASSPKTPGPGRTRKRKTPPTKVNLVGGVFQEELPDVEPDDPGGDSFENDGYGRRVQSDSDDDADPFSEDDTPPRRRKRKSTRQKTAAKKKTCRSMETGKMKNLELRTVPFFMDAQWTHLECIGSAGQHPAV